MCRCLLLPWLIFSMMGLIILGCPIVIFFSLLGTYLLLQVCHYTRAIISFLLYTHKGLFLPALLSYSTPTLLVLVAMSLWLTVLAAYWALGNKYYESVR